MYMYMYIEDLPTYKCSFQTMFMWQVLDDADILCDSFYEQLQQIMALYKVHTSGSRVPPAQVFYEH